MQESDMKQNRNKKSITTILLAFTLALGSASCSDSGDDTPKTKETLTIKCPNPDCEYTRPGDPESLSVVDTCPKCFGKLKP
jgi:hypothetical protein